MGQHEHLTAFISLLQVDSTTAGMAGIYATSASPLLPHWDRGTSPHSRVMQAERVSCFDLEKGQTPCCNACWDGWRERERKKIHERGSECVNRDYPIEAPGPSSSKINCEDWRPVRE
jgi:hypothetical protein